MTPQRPCAAYREVVSRLPAEFFAAPSPDTGLALTAIHVLDGTPSIWHMTPETARQVAGRLGYVRGLSVLLNPFTDRGGL